MKSMNVLPLKFACLKILFYILLREYDEIPCEFINKISSVTVLSPLGSCPDNSDFHYASGPGTGLNHDAELKLR